MSSFEAAKHFVFAKAYLIVLFSSLALYGIYAVRQWLLPKPLPGIPYNRNAAKWIWGDAPALRDDPGGLAKWCSKQLAIHDSPICQAMMGPFSKPLVLVADVGETREMLMGRSDFDRSVYISDRFPLFGKFHLNMKTGDDWRQSRGWLKNLLSPSYLDEVVSPAMYSSILKLIELWSSKNQVANGRPFSMVEDMHTLALEVVVAFNFGDDFKDSGLNRQIQCVKELDPSKLTVGKHNVISFPQAPLHAFQQGLADLGDKIVSIYATRWPPSIVSWWTRYMSPYYRRAFVNKDIFIRKHIDLALQRLHNNEEAKTAVDHMVFREQKASQKKSRPPLYRDQIMIDEVYGNLIAGQHTTSAALVWILKFLADYPDVQDKLRDELQTVCSTATQENRIPTVDEIMNFKMPYLDAVLEETLRLRAAMLVPRDATRDTELLGRRIPKGTTVLLVCQGPDYAPNPASEYWSNLKSERQYPGGGNADLNVFDPERWLVQNDKGETVFDGTAYPQLAFGLGIRACWGRRLAEIEIRIMTVLMTWKFDFLEVTGDLASHDATYDISYRSEKGYVRLKSR